MKRRTLKAALGDSDLADRLRKFQVVVKIAIQLRRSGVQNIKTTDRIGLLGLAAREFDLNKDQAQYCIGRVQNFLDDIRNAERVRNAAKHRRSPSPA